MMRCTDTQTAQEKTPLFHEEREIGARFGNFPAWSTVRISVVCDQK
jgi:hypothetical protein